MELCMGVLARIATVFEHDAGVGQFRGGERAAAAACDAEDKCTDTLYSLSRCVSPHPAAAIARIASPLSFGNARRARCSSARGFRI
eukprot:3342417-Rhodomonas_salina.1